VACPRILNIAGGFYNYNNAFKLTVVVIPKTQIREFQTMWGGEGYNI